MLVSGHKTCSFGIMTVGRTYRSTFEHRLQHKMEMADIHEKEKIIEMCHLCADNFSGYSIEEICNGISNNDSAPTFSKSVGEAVVLDMLKHSSGDIDDVKKIIRTNNMIIKTITVTNNGTRTEDMKLLAVNFNEFKDNRAEYVKSELYHFLKETELICAVFREKDEGDNNIKDNSFIGFKLYEFGKEIVEKDAKTIWEKIHELIISRELRDVIARDETGEPIINKNGKVRSAPNFPKSKGHIVFLRGSGADSSDKCLEINGIKMLRQNYWIRGKYIVEMLTDMDFI